MEDAADMVRLVGRMINIPLSISISSLELALSTLRGMQKVITAEPGTTNAGASQTATPPIIHGAPAPSPAQSGQAQPAPTLQADSIRDTYNGLAAFVVPGMDIWSAAQGATSSEPGAVSTHVADVMIGVLDRTVPSPPQAPPSSAMIASLLNQVAQKVNPSAGGNFASDFSKLSFREKVAVFQFIEGDPSMQPFKRIGGLLAFFVAFIFYSEASVFDFATHRLKGRPAGWVATNYNGDFDGSCQFKGYFRDRRHAEKSTDCA